MFEVVWKWNDGSEDTVEFFHDYQIALEHAADTLTTNLLSVTITRKEKQT